MSADDYASLVDEAHQFLTGKSRSVLRRLSADMGEAAEAMDFERAARLRDRIRALSAISMEQSINPETVDEADVFALHAEGGQACVQVFFFRAGQNWGNRAYFPPRKHHDRHGRRGGDGRDRRVRRDHGSLPGPVLRGQAGPAD